MDDRSKDDRRGFLGPGKLPGVTSVARIFRYLSAPPAAQLDPVVVPPE